MHRIGTPAALLVFALALLASPLAGHADEAAPPVAGDATADAEPFDLIEYVRILRRSLRHYETPAPRTEKVTALHDAWTAILRPRARRMTTRLESWEKPTRWIRPADGGPTVGLAPKQWSAFTRDAASLAAELHGAWTQYGSVELRGKQTVSGIAVLPRPPRLTSGYGFPTVDGRVVVRAAGEGETEIIDSDVSAYHVLLDRCGGRWRRRLEARREYFQWWRRQEAAYQRTFEDLENELAHTRTSLAEDLAGLKTLVAALQRIEEQRLETMLQVHPEGAAREKAQDALGSLANARTAAETYDGPTASKYGALLRDWLRHRTTTSRALAK